MEGKIIQMFIKPFNRDRFNEKEETREISLKQHRCSHVLEIDEDLDEHLCTNCGKPFSTKEALLYILHQQQENIRVKISSYNLRNEINFLAEKIDKLKDDVKHIQSEKRKLKKI